MCQLERNQSFHLLNLQGGAQKKSLRKIATMTFDRVKLRNGFYAVSADSDVQIMRNADNG